MSKWIPFRFGKIQRLGAPIIKIEMGNFLAFDLCFHMSYSDLKTRLSTEQVRVVGPVLGTLEIGLNSGRNSVKNRGPTRLAGSITFARGSLPPPNPYIF